MEGSYGTVGFKNSFVDVDLWLIDNGSVPQRTNWNIASGLRPHVKTSLPSFPRTIADRISDWGMTPLFYLMTMPSYVCRGECFYQKELVLYSTDPPMTCTHGSWNMTDLFTYTVIGFMWVSAKFGICTVVIVNGTLVEEKMRRFKGECAHFSFNNYPIYTHDGASAKLSTCAAGIHVAWIPSSR